MPGEVYIARQDTLESVKADTQQIFENTKKNYKSICGTINVTPTITDWLEVLNITGKGYLTQVLGYVKNTTYSYGSVRDAYMKITIDDVVVYNGKIAGTVEEWGSVGYIYKYGGFVLREYISALSSLGSNGQHAIYLYGDSLTTNRRDNFVLTQLPHIDNSYKVALLTIPVYFNSNVKIEVKNIYESQPNCIEYIGGVEIA